MLPSLLFFGIVTVFCTVSLAEETDLKDPIGKEDSERLLESRSTDLNIHDVHKFRKEYTLFCLDSQVSFMQAFRLCIDKGLQLATDESYSDSKKLAKLLIDNNQVEPVWIAGTDLGEDGSWIWLSTMRLVGEITNYLRWNDNEPSASGCMTAELNDNKIAWNATDCALNYCYVCQTFSSNLVI